MATLVHAELVAVLVAVTQAQPRVLTMQHGRLLPAGPFEDEHRSLQTGLREWVEAQTQHPLGYVEQLYTFADRDRSTARGARVVSISYLALGMEASGGAASADAGLSGALGVGTPQWHDWYRYFPWEDWRQGQPAVVARHIAPALHAWCAQAAWPALRQQREQRVTSAFGATATDWNEELVLQRYELLYEAGLVPEAAQSVPEAWVANLGAPMGHDHRRILATGIARLRAKIKYRPVMFELMPPSFSLLQLQQTVEALAGRVLHKQNFRRLIEQQNLVEETGESVSLGAGRPAKLFRFRREVVFERASMGSKLPLMRSGG